MSRDRLGFIGLGNMGGPMAANLAAAGYELGVYDIAGSAALAPRGTRPVATVEELAATADSVFLSLPDGAASLDVAGRLAAAPQRGTTTVIDLSTIGIEAARQAHSVLTEAAIDYVDAPVSGGRAGARAGTVTLMWAGSEPSWERHRAVVRAMAGKVVHVGRRPGQGQAMKLLNNFLSATALAATSEAMAFGLSQGLDLETMLDVVNVSTGRNTATTDKFPNRILTGTYDAGFATALMAKDLALYAQSVETAGTADPIGRAVTQLWQRAHDKLPGSDFTRIYDFVKAGA